MLSFLIIFGVTLALLELAAWFFGADSRDGDDWFTHNPNLHMERR